MEPPDAIVKGHRYEVELVTEPVEASPLVAEYGARQMEILANRELQNKSGPHPSERSTRHIVLAVPEGVTYEAGDHLGILPRNSAALVRRVTERFELPEDALIRIRKNTATKTFLPVDTPVSASSLLSAYVDLQGVARRSEIQVLAEYTECPPEKEKLLALGCDDPDGVARYREEVLSKNVSLIDLLEEHRSCELPLNVYLELLPQLKPRYYSISSSPLVDPTRLSITVGVVEGPARSGLGEYQGVCSSYVSPGRHHVRPPCARACLPGRPIRRPGHSPHHIPQPVKSNIRPGLLLLRSGIHPLLCSHLALGGSAQGGGDLPGPPRPSRLQLRPAATEPSRGPGGFAFHPGEHPDRSRRLSGTFERERGR
ncbi:MAG TPA: hypothetical protein VFH16_06255 [Rubrobacter sp.]|nr:hypothetical protein [Rubrobacter sp.]